jgi:hypothetical protein
MVYIEYDIPIAPIPDRVTIPIVSGILLLFSWTTVGLRTWTRIRIVKNFGWDDFSMLVALV